MRAPEQVMPMHRWQDFKQMEKRQERASNPHIWACSIKKGTLTLAKGRDTCRAHMINSHSDVQFKKCREEMKV